MKYSTLGTHAPFAWKIGRYCICTVRARGGTGGSRVGHENSWEDDPFRAVPIDRGSHVPPAPHLTPPHPPHARNLGSAAQTGR